MAKPTPRQRRHPHAHARGGWKLWLGWAAATTAGGAAGALLRGVVSGIVGKDGGISEAWVALLAMPALMAVVQWLVVRRRLTGGGNQLKNEATLRWRVAALAGCIPALSVTLHGTSASAALTDALIWYAPVALFAGFLSASAQNEVLAAAFGWPASRRFLPLTVLGWTIAWPLWIAGVAAGRMPWVVGLAWTCAGCGDRCAFWDRAGSCCPPATIQRAAHRGNRAIPTRWHRRYTAAGA